MSARPTSLGRAREVSKKPSWRPFRRLGKACLLTLALVSATGLVDVATGRFISAPLYVPAVLLVSWSSGLTGAALASATSIGVHAIVEHAYERELPAEEFLETPSPWWSTALRLSIYLGVGIALARLRQLLDERNALIRQLQAAAAEIRTLQGLLPICAWCKQIRDDEHGVWVPIERYVSQRSDATFTHGICPNCAHKTFNKATGKTD